MVFAGRTAKRMRLYKGFPEEDKADMEGVEGVWIL